MAAFSVKSVSGGLASLLRYKRALELSKNSLNKALPQMQVASFTFLRNRFVKGLDPYGNRWKRRKGRHGNPILRRTRRLQRSLRVFRRGFTLVMVYTAPYADFHQTGAPPQNAARLLVPDGRGIPPKLQTIYRRIIRKQLQAQLV